VNSTSFRQLGLGRDEHVLDPEPPIIDAHHHLFVRPTLHYMLDEYLQDVQSGHNIIASVYVEAGSMRRPDGPEMLRPLGEIEFANQVGIAAASADSGNCRVCAAIVGYADFRFGDAIGEYLDQALAIAPDRLRGFRQVAIDHPTDAPYRFIPVPPPRGLLRHPSFRDGFAHLATHGLSFDAAVFHHQLDEIAELADSFPDTTIVLDHSGHTMCLGMDADERADIFCTWRSNLHALSRRPNVLCKIGGLGLPFWGFGFEERTDPIGYLELARVWKPYVESSIEIFGATRCMFESNYPPDSRSCGYVPLWNAFKYIVRDLSADARAAVFYGTAARVYRIDLPGIR
jgi:L-fuconolactonase